jgi:regulation of enolase protein 1 (concanavalin A-like superfamily)
MPVTNELQWLNKPRYSEFRDGALFIRTDNETDFWRETFYDFWRDSGHFAYQTVEGDFTAEVTIDGRYEALYDQAGLMVRLSETHWLKAGIEYTDDQICFSVVVTNDTSDWSMLKIASAATELRMRLTRHGETMRVQYFDVENNQWQMVRLAYLPRSASIDVGMMCCSPQREGFEVTFRDFKIGAPISRELHE